MIRRTRIWLVIVVAFAWAATARAQDAAPDSAAADTGWVEIGGKDGFGADDPFADLPSGEEESTRPTGGKFAPYLSYNRVDQFQIGLDMKFTPSTGWLPGFFSRTYWAAERKGTGGESDGAWLYELGLTQPFDERRRGTVGISIYRLTDDDRFGQVGDTENALAAFLFHWDYKDWFEREGYALDGQYTFRDRWHGTVHYAQDSYTSITAIADNTRGLFRRDAEWRDNPAIDDGNLRSVTMGLGYDSRSDPSQPRRGMWHRLSAETAGGSLGGDWTFIRYLGDFRGYLSPGPSHLVKARAMVGTTSESGDLPFQKTFAVGGISTLPGLSFRHFRGRHLFLLNGDWSWEVLRRSSKNAAIKTGLSVTLFSDFGLAWDNPTWDLGHRKPAWDAGLGLGTSDEHIRVNFARDVRAERAPVIVSLRVTRAY